MTKLFSNIVGGFSEKLPFDDSFDDKPRQVVGFASSAVFPKKPLNPSLVLASEEVAEMLGIGKKDIHSEEFLGIVSGQQIQADTTPYSMNYGGHQFGHWAGQLGDGRAINLFDVFNNGATWTLQLKGAGPTPYSRTADGLAVMRSSIREFLCSEAMHHLNVPTTRALSLVLTGDQVLRDVMYNGNPAFEPGAIVCRVAPSFIRFGNFEIFAARQEYGLLKLLADYTIDHYFPQNKETGKARYVTFFNAVCQSTLKLMIEWHRVGFVHGVMNTDNLSILGLTIDYGPYGWVDNYDYGWTPNTTDRSEKRYRFGNQANIALWNLVKLANALYPLIEDAEPLEAAFAEYQTNYRPSFIEMMGKKIGLQTITPEDDMLITELEKLLHEQEIDMSIFFRSLANFKKEDARKKDQDEWIDTIKNAFYQAFEPIGELKIKWLEWLHKYIKRIASETDSDYERKTKMNQINPKYVLRNYMAQQAIEKAESGDYTMVKEIFEMLKNPYGEQAHNEKWFAKRPDWARNKVGSSMLSCSS